VPSDGLQYSERYFFLQEVVVVSRSEKSD